MDSSSDQAPIESHRSWWKLHLLTWVLVLLVGGSVVVENLVVQYSYTGHSRKFSQPLWPRFGWPFVYKEEILLSSEGEIGAAINLDLHSQGKLLLSFRIFLDYSLLLTNILIALAILTSTIFTTESYLRRQAKWHQFSIGSIMALTAFVALILANTKYDLVRWRTG